MSSFRSTRQNRFFESISTRSTKSVFPAESVNRSRTDRVSLIDLRASTSGRAGSKSAASSKTMTIPSWPSGRESYFNRYRLSARVSTSAFFPKAATSPNPGSLVRERFEVGRMSSPCSIFFSNPTVTSMEPRSEAPAVSRVLINEISFRRLRSSLEFWRRISCWVNERLTALPTSLRLTWMRNCARSPSASSNRR